MSNIKNAADYISLRMPSVNRNHPNPIETLSIEDIIYLQEYLEKIKMNKINQKPRRTEYFNPYDCGSKQNIYPPTYRDQPCGPYMYDQDMLDKMGLPNQPYPEHIRNINVESSLIQNEITRNPGQKEVIEKPVNRFQYLPFNPQNSDHLVWEDNMPRGGYSTRNARLNSNSSM